MGSLELEYKLVEVEEIVFDEFFNFAHFELHPLFIVVYQVGAEEQGFGVKQLDVVDFVLLYDQMPFLLDLIRTALHHLTIGRQEPVNHRFLPQLELLLIIFLYLLRDLYCLL